MIKITINLERDKHSMDNVKTATTLPGTSLILGGQPEIQQLRFSELPIPFG